MADIVLAAAIRAARGVADTLAAGAAQAVAAGVALVGGDALARHAIAGLADAAGRLGGARPAIDSLAAVVPDLAAVVATGPRLRRRLAPLAILAPLTVACLAPSPPVLGPRVVERGEEGTEYREGDEQRQRAAPGARQPALRRSDVPAARDVRYAARWS
ncbi:MAG: hypothetical protein KC442_13925 [Thermomicrobiales bacterium]|nr:hypothetical protein [Thermomicrobiales bacterium]